MDGCGWGPTEEDEEEREEKKEKEGDGADIKSNNPHLTGGELFYLTAESNNDGA